MYDSMRVMEPLCAVSLFSGVGGLDLGLERAGIRIVAQCESDEWKRTILAAHWPDTPCHDDVSTMHLTARPGGVGAGGGTLGGGRSERPADDSRPGVPCEGADGGGHAAVASASGLSISRGVDLLTGGFPCQDLSVAGHRAGLAGSRSGLFHEFARIADALRPTWLLVENVPGLLSSNSGRDFGVVLATLAELGYSVAWRVLDARYFGVPQRRRRVFVVGHLGGDDRPALRALCESCGGDSPTLNCSWQATRPNTAHRPGRACVTFAGSADNPGIAAPLLASAQGGTRTTDIDGGTWVASTLRSGSHSDDVRPPGRPDDGNLVAFHPTWGGAKGLSETVDHAPGAGTGHGGAIGIARGSQVRRLTPVECERLMSWPDGWTAPEGVRAPDSRRYHACGDGVVANVSEWIGRRILAEHSRGGVA